MNRGVPPISLTQLRPTHVCLKIINPPTSIRTNHYLHAIGRIAALNCDFERRAGDVSVDRPTLVEFYRAPQAIAVRDEQGVADTEELRQAVVHYRALFDELLEVKEAKQEAMPPKQMAVQA